MKIKHLLVVSPVQTKWKHDAWSVVFETEDGKHFICNEVMQLNKPELHHIQYNADIHPKHFWEYWAQPVMGWAICALDGTPIATLYGFATEREAQDKLKDLTERGIISGIPIRIEHWD